MIKSSFIRRQVEKSRAQGRTSNFLRRLIFYTVDRAAQDYYGESYPTRCFQCSSAIADLLSSLGIEARMVVGAVCLPDVFVGACFAQWGGFWNEDHHVWSFTEFGELVDLSIGLMNKHPRSTRRDGLPNPCVWWTNCGQWPAMIRYLPDTAIGRDLGDGPDAADLRSFREHVMSMYSKTTQRLNVEAIKFGPILDGVDTLNSLADAGDPWAMGAFGFQHLRVQMPAWIRDREGELMKCWRTGQPASSRLRSIPGLFNEES